MVNEAFSKHFLTMTVGAENSTSSLRFHHKLLSEERSVGKWAGTVEGMAENNCGICFYSTWVPFCSVFYEYLLPETKKGSCIATSFTWAGFLHWVIYVPVRHPYTGKCKLLLQKMKRDVFFSEICDPLMPTVGCRVLEGSCIFGKTEHRGVFSVGATSCQAFLTSDTDSAMRASISSHGES